MSRESAGCLLRRANKTPSACMFRKENWRRTADSGYTPVRDLPSAWRDLLLLFSCLCLSISISPLFRTFCLSLSIHIFLLTFCCYIEENNSKTFVSQVHENSTSSILNSTSPYCRRTDSKILHGNCGTATSRDIETKAVKVN